MSSTRVALRAALAAGLGGIVAIHVVDAASQWSELRYLFWIYMALIAAATAVGAAALWSRSALVFPAASVLAAAVMAGFVLSRTAGLPHDASDVGNWSQPLGIASLVVEAAVIAAGIAGARAARRPGARVNRRTSTRTSTRTRSAL